MFINLESRARIDNTIMDRFAMNKNFFYKIFTFVTYDNHSFF